MLAGSRRTTSHLKTCLIEASDLDKIQTWAPTTGEWSNRVSSVTNENRAWLKGAFLWRSRLAGLLAVCVSFRSHPVGLDMVLTGDRSVGTRQRSEHGHT